MEQKQKLFCLILYGPLVQKHQDFSKVLFYLPSELFFILILYPGVMLMEMSKLNTGVMLIKLPQDKMVTLVERLFSHRCNVPVRKVGKSFQRKLSEKFKSAGGHCPCGTEISFLVTISLHPFHIRQIP